MECFHLRLCTFSTQFSNLETSTVCFSWGLSRLLDFGSFKQILVFSTLSAKPRSRFQLHWREKVVLWKAEEVEAALTWFVVMLKSFVIWFSKAVICFICFIVSCWHFAWSEPLLIKSESFYRGRLKFLFLVYKVPSPTLSDHSEFFKSLSHISWIIYSYKMLKSHIIFQ